VTCLRANGAAYGCDGDGTDPVPTVVRLGLTVRDSASTADYTTTLVGERRRT
jgi:hypothetical protein